MPRTLTQERFNWLVPRKLLAELQRISLEEDVATAELARRIGDLVLTFELGARVVAPEMDPEDVITRFTIYISPWMLDKLTVVALGRSLTVHELLRQGGELYLMRKRSRAYSELLGLKPHNKPIDSPHMVV